MIELNDISLGYDHRAILNNVNMKAMPGQKWLGEVNVN